METSEKIVFPKFDATLLLAGCTLWLYLVAISYLRGYLGAFGARPDWFSPTVFQLIAFTHLGFVPAIVLVLLLRAMQSGRIISAVLAGALWIVITAIMRHLYVQAMAPSNQPIGSFVRYAGLWIYGYPIVSVVSNSVGAGISRAVNKVQPTQADLDRLERFGKVFQLDRLAHFFLGWKIQAVRLLFDAYLVAVIASLSGATAGATDFATFLEANCPTLEDNQRSVIPIFSDGTRSLAMERYGTWSGVLYRDQSLSHAIWLAGGSPVESGAPATMPTTRPK